jgi:hypothetical protein
VVTLSAAVDYMMVARLFVLSSQSTSHLPSFKRHPRVITTRVMTELSLAPLAAARSE